MFEVQRRIDHQQAALSRRIGESLSSGQLETALAGFSAVWSSGQGCAEHGRAGWIAKETHGTAVLIEIDRIVHANMKQETKPLVEFCGLRGRA